MNGERFSIFLARAAKTAARTGKSARRALRSVVGRRRPNLGILRQLPPAGSIEEHVDQNRAWERGDLCVQ